MIIEKNTSTEEDKFYKYPCHTTKIKKQFILKKDDGLERNTLTIESSKKSWVM